MKDLKSRFFKEIMALYRRKKEIRAPRRDPQALATRIRSYIFISDTIVQFPLTGLLFKIIKIMIYDDFYLLNHDLDDLSQIVKS